MQQFEWRRDRILQTHACVRALLLLMILTASFLGASLIFGSGSISQAQTAGDSLYAVLFDGNDPEYVFRNDLKFAFKTLINDYGYAKENIIVMYYDGSGINLDDDGLSDVDFSATRENADTVFARLKRVMTDGDILFFFATAHGTHLTDTPHSDCTDAAICVYSGNDIYDDHLAAYLDSLDTPTRRITKIVLLVTCYAGGFVPEIIALDPPAMIATASKQCEESNFMRCPSDTIISCDYNAYSFHWFAAMHGSTPDGTMFTHADSDNDGYISISEAAKFARESDEYAQKTSIPKEYPLYSDSDCMTGKRWTLNGRIPMLNGTVVFSYPCHDPLPCRWGSWRCIGGASPVISGWGGGARGEAASRGATSVIGGLGGPLRSSAGAETRVWANPVPAPGETTFVCAEVHNPGDTPLTSAEVNFYASDPTMSLIVPQSGLAYLGTKVIPMLPPHATITVGPVQFVPPLTGNYFGEPHWTLLATAEHPDSPVETGWMAEDDHVAAYNGFHITSYAQVPKSIHLAARNTLDVPVRAVLSIDDSALPSGWSAVMSPSAGDTIDLDPYAWVPVEVAMTGIAGPAREGFVDVSMEFSTMDAKECASCDDSTCGGYIGVAGGCSIKLEVEPPVAVGAPKITIQSTVGAIVLTWEAGSGDGTLGFNVYRAEKAVGQFRKINEAPVTGSGKLIFKDKTALPGTVYLYMLGILESGSERLSEQIEASLVQPYELALMQNYPNPFNPMTTISFTLPERMHVTLSVYATDGTLVTTLANEILDKGEQKTAWDGRNARGNPVASGIYFYRLEAGKHILTRKMALLR